MRLWDSGVEGRLSGRIRFKRRVGLLSTATKEPRSGNATLQEADFGQQRVATNRAKPGDGNFPDRDL
jgi:hypothetical protein